MLDYPDADKKSYRRIFTIGGGKGGVGKSIIAANLAIGLAQQGKKVIIIDADLGAANLHAILGIKSPPVGIKDFIFNDYLLEDVIINTGIENLKFISGAGDVPGISNIQHQIRLKLISQLKSLTADYIVVDLAPGINYNTIDFFNITDTGILVVMPEVTSILNAYSYIKGALYRRIIKAFQNNAEAKEMIELLIVPYNRLMIDNITDIRNRAGKFSDLHREMLDNVINTFHPKLIVNKIRRNKDRGVGENIKLLVNKNLGVEMENLGYVVESDAVKKSIEDMNPFIIKTPHDKASKCIKEIVSQISNSHITASDS